MWRRYRSHRFRRNVIRAPQIVEAVGMKQKAEMACEPKECGFIRLQIAHGLAGILQRSEHAWPAITRLSIASIKKSSIRR